MELHNGCLKRPWRKYWNISGMCMHKKGWRKYIQIQGKFITFMQYKYLSIDKWQLHTIGFSVGKGKEKTVHLLERIQDREMSLYRSKELCSYVFLFKVHHSSPIKYKQDSIGILKTFFFPHLCIIFILPRILMTSGLIRIILFITGRYSETGAVWK